MGFAIDVSPQLMKQSGGVKQRGDLSGGGLEGRFRGREQE
jgi:hypothetical protein